MVRNPNAGPAVIRAPLTIIAGQRELVGLWMIRHIPELTDLPGGYEAIGVARGNELVGGCLFTEYRPCPDGGNIVMWAVGHNWISRKVIGVMFGYPFLRLNCHRVTALIRRGNKASRKMVEDLGFVQEGKVRRGYSTREDLILYGFLRSECAWELT